MTTTVYKIRHKITGLYSRGGSYVRWSKTGKIWKRKSDLVNSLLLALDEGYNRTRDQEDSKNWEIEELDIVLVTTHTVDEMLTSARENREKRREAQLLKEKREQRKRDERLLADLKKKLGHD